MSGTSASSPGIADRDQDERPFVFRPAEDLAEGAHRARAVRQRAEPGGLQRGEQEADGDPDRLAHVVVLDLAAVLRPPRLLEDDDHVRHVGDVRLDPVGADRPDRLLPLVGYAPVVEVALLRLGAFAQPPLGLGFGDDDEGPRLLVRPRRRRARREDRVLDELARDRLRREPTHRAPGLKQLEELARARERLVDRQALVEERDGAVLRRTRAP
jgi:hypothetical protein